MTTRSSYISPVSGSTAVLCGVAVEHEPLALVAAWHLPGRPVAPRDAELGLGQAGADLVDVLRPGGPAHEVVASVIKRGNGTFGVEDMWVSFDAGTIVNSYRVRAQLEGAVVFGMSLAFYGGITMKGVAIEQDNFRGGGTHRTDQRSPRRISVDLVESTAAPGGVGEPGVPPAAGAIANAVFGLTGQRIRELPLSKSIPV